MRFVIPLFSKLARKYFKNSALGLYDIVAISYFSFTPQLHAKAVSLGLSAGQPGSKESVHANIPDVDLKILTLACSHFASIAVKESERGRLSFQVQLFHCSSTHDLQHLQHAKRYADTFFEILASLPQDKPTFLPPLLDADIATPVQK